MITLYTIGFTGKSAKKFFGLLEQNQIKKIIDTRISNHSQLAGFAKEKDLEFFARRLADIDYAHELAFAPTKELLSKYRKKQISWEEYTKEYISLLDERNIKAKVNPKSLQHCCLLCSEDSPEKCHRRLLAEYLQTLDPTIEIVHLK